MYENTRDDQKNLKGGRVCITVISYRNDLCKESENSI